MFALLLISRKFLTWNTPDFISSLIWPPNSPPSQYTCEECSSNGSTTTSLSDHLKQCLVKSGVSSSSITKQCNSGVFKSILVPAKMAAILSTNCNRQKLDSRACLHNCFSKQCAFIWKLTLQDQLFMAALHSRCGHYIFALWFLLSIYLLFFTA